MTDQTPAEINLRECQTQLDMDGCQVGVSRQALEEALDELASLRAEIDRLRAALTQILQAAVLSNHQAPPEGARHCPLCIAVSVARTALAPQEERKG